MDLRQLEYFLAVVENGGINRAAVALHVAQPSLSQAIRKLEKGLGAELFHRVGRGLVLAPAGESLLGPARSILREAEAVQREVRSVGRGPGGRVDIAALSDMSTDPLAVWVARFRTWHPDVRFRIEERNEAAEVIDLVRSGACELGLATPPLTTDLVVERIADQRFVLVCPPGTEDFWPDPTPLEALHEVPLVIGDADSPMRRHLQGLLQQRNIQPRVVVEVPRRGAVIPIVLFGGGAAIVPLRIGLDAKNRGAVVRELLPGLSRPIELVRRPGNLTAAAMEFIEASKASLRVWHEVVNQMVADGHSLVDATSLAIHDADERARELNRHQASVRPIHT